MTASLEKTLSKLTLEELVEARDQVDKLITNYQKGKRKELQQQFKAMAAEAGFALDEIVGSVGSKGAAVKPEKKRHYPIKYRNPDNPEQAWTGLGMKPRWVREALDNGKTLDNLRV